MIQEFKSFIMKGNVVDLAVGVVIGAAFGKIVTSLVEDIMMPLIWLLTGGMDFTTLTYTVGDAVINYGNFIQITVNFLVVALAIFIFVVKPVNALNKKEKEAPAPSGPTDNDLLVEIRDLLKK